MMKKIIISSIVVALLLGVLLTALLISQDRYCYHLPGIVYLKLSSSGITLLSCGYDSFDNQSSNGQFYASDNVRGIRIESGSRYNEIREDLKLLTQVKTIDSLTIYGVEGKFNFDDIKGMDLIKISIFESVQVDEIRKVKYLANLERYIHYSENLSDLSHLSPLKNLKELYLSGKFKSIKPLSSLNLLEDLRISSMMLDSLEGIGEISNLRELSIAESSLNDSELSRIAEIEKLKVLRLYSNRMTALPDLSVLPRLSTLEIGGPKLADITQLRKIFNMYNLTINSPNINDEDLRKELPALKKLDQLVLYNMNLKNMAFLDMMKKMEGNKNKLVLQELRLYDCKIEDRSHIDKYTFYDLIIE